MSFSSITGERCVVPGMTDVGEKIEDDERELSTLPAKGVGTSAAAVALESIPSGGTASLSKHSAKSLVKFLRGFSGLAVPKAFVSPLSPLGDVSLSSEHAAMVVLAKSNPMLRKKDDASLVCVWFGASWTDSKEYSVKKSVESCLNKETQRRRLRGLLCTLQ